MKLVLASTSPRRKELLEKHNYKFIIDSVGIDETFFSDSTAIENVIRVARLKGLGVYEKYKEDMVLSCDTIVCLDGVVYGKPKDSDDAYRMLKSLSGKMHEVISGVFIISPSEYHNFTVTSKVYFKELTDEEINEYIASGECFGKAGGYAIQGIGRKLVSKYEGDLENIIGLPVSSISKVLDKYGF